MKKIIIVSLSIIVIGVVLSVVGSVMGGKKEIEKNISEYTTSNSKDSVTINEEIKPFKTIDVDSDLNNVEIIKSDKYALEMKYEKDKEDVSYSVENGKLSIKGTQKESEKKNIGILSNVKILNKEVSKYIKIYVPSDANLDVMNIKSLAGDISINEIKANKTIINCETGDIKLDNVKTNGLKVDNENGDIQLNGEFTGDTNIKCEQGDIKMNNNIEEALYNYNFSCKLGDIKVNGKDFENNATRNGAQSNNIDISSQNGDIEVNFK